MVPLPQAQFLNVAHSRPPLWLRLSSLPTLITSVGLLALSLGLNIHVVGFPGLFIPAILICLAFAIFLATYSLWQLRQEHQGTDKAFHATHCEFSSIFLNVLDGILILDSKANCIDGNPAAARILRVARSELIGKSISVFFADSDAFSKEWENFLQSSSRRGRAELVAGDGTTVFVDFTAAANYLPGRHIFILCDVTERMRAERSLRKSEERFQLMANNIQEIFWMMQADTQELTYVNSAYTTITGHAVESLHENPSAYQDLIHPEDRIRILSKLRDLARSGTLDEEFRFIRADGAIRWAWAKGVPVPADAETRWLVGTAQDITSRKQAEMKIIEQLDAVEAARAEAEALRKSTLALSQNLAMDSVLDTLLQCISELVPFDRATVLFVEDGFELMVAREAPRIVPKRIGLTFRASENKFLERVLFEKRATLVPDVAKEGEWRDAPPLDHLHCWLGIPLLAAGRVLGILSLGSNAPHILTAEHLRLAKSLAVPAAVAIQNARAHERAEIYAAELELRLHELHETQNALKNADNRSSRQVD
jgi:PAS domain S-box-containing protein